ncbi:MAG: ABC transporter ATP-binding protein [Chlorobi bacterium]|nr:ABC transporter ATP-binding protein [Chlorobiota bacterium]
MENILEANVKQILKDKPYINDFFDAFGLDITKFDGSIREFIESLSEDTLEDLALTKELLYQSFSDFIAGMDDINEEMETVDELTIIGGQDKSGNPENIMFTIKKGEVVCIVGPTGSGKSRLLGDIEWVAQADTPTKRKILINGKTPDSKWRFSSEHKLVAQLSQNMNFVMDLTVKEFVTLHAESRLVENPEEKVKMIIDMANELAGEEFSPNAHVTSLSGGQSRSLMIADTAFLSKSPIVLIDEIENAGIDRRKALELLVREEKIVLMATHDPILALMGDKRLVIKNGGISKIIESSKEERKHLPELEKLDKKLLELRNRIRLGEMITEV